MRGRAVLIHRGAKKRVFDEVSDFGIPTPTVDRRGIVRLLYADVGCRNGVTQDANNLFVFALRRAPAWLDSNFREAVQRFEIIRGRWRCFEACGKLVKEINSQRAAVRATDEAVPQALSGYRPRVPASLRPPLSSTTAKTPNVGSSPSAAGASRRGELAADSARTRHALGRRAVAWSLACLSARRLVVEPDDHCAASSPVSR